jgi:hypothetical protein
VGKSHHTSNVVENITRINDLIRRSLTEVFGNRATIPPPIKLIMHLLQERSQRENR